MGTDIHLIVQRRVDDRWEVIPPPTGKRKWADFRDYNSFAVMANVRNGYGVAGISTGDGFRPIALPRGLPNDCEMDDSEHTRDGIWLGDHSFSWLMLDEILNYDWDQWTFAERTATAESYRLHKQGDHAKLIGGMFGRDVEHVSNEDMEARIAGGDTHPGLVTTVRWKQTYREACQSIITLAEQLRDLGCEPKDTRLVFGFDS